MSPRSPDPQTRTEPQPQPPSVSRPAGEGVPSLGVEVDPQALAGAMRGLRALAHLARLGPDDLRALTLFCVAVDLGARARDVTLLDALIEACARLGMHPPADGSDPVAWLDQQLRAMTVAVGKVLDARGELGYAGVD